MTDTMRDELIGEVWEILTASLMMDESVTEMSTTIVDKIIIPLRDDIQAGCDQAIRATEQQAEIERSRGGFHD